MKINKIFHTILLFSLLMGSVGIQKTHALGTPQIVGINPPSPAQVGTCITIRARVDWDSEYRAMRIRFGNEGWQESSETEFERNFCTNNYSPGWYTIRVEVAGQGDNSWSNPRVTEAQYELTGQPEPSKGPSISQFNFNPSGGANVGDSVNIHIKVDSSNPGATTLTADCGGLSQNENTSVEFDSNWNTSGCPAQAVNILVCSRAVDDPNWTNATCSTRSYTLSSPPAVVPVPIAELWVDSTQISKGQCTYLHWQTSNADRVDIDGNTVQSSGDQQVCPTVTKKYSLSATNQSGSANRNLTVIVSDNQQPSSVADYFQTKDIIQIGNDIYVIVNGERRLVPNPETLDALGITRSWINNKGFGDSDLKTIPLGQDIPDVNLDPAGFAAFKEKYFSNTTPIVPGTEPTAPPVPNQPQEPNVPSNGQWQVGARVGLCAGAQMRSGSGFSYSTHTIVPENNWQVDIIDGPRNNGGVTWWDVSRANIDGGGTGWVYFEQAGICSISEPQNSNLDDNPQNRPETNTPEEQNTQTDAQKPNYCNLWIIGSFLCPPEVQAYEYEVNLECKPQCVIEAKKHRSDISKWSDGGTPANILTDAKENPTFKLENEEYSVKVRSASEDPQSGDLVVWSSACGWEGGGHIGYVEDYRDGKIYVTDSNWGTPLGASECNSRNNKPINKKDCMSFITMPQSVEPNPNESQPSDPSTQNPPSNPYLGFACKLVPSLWFCKTGTW